MNGMTRLAAAVACAVLSQAAYGQVTENVLYSFTGGSDGAYPGGALLAGTSGPPGTMLGLYGTAYAGGADGDGTVFALSLQHGQKTWAFSTRWSFTGGSDGSAPDAGLLSTSKRFDGTTLSYGTTSGGADGYGTVFSLTDGALTTIWTFTGGADGGYPYGSPVADKSGSLYVSTGGGGSGGCGTIIQLTPPGVGQSAWTETTLYSFTGAADGCSANGLIIDGHGRLFATTYYGGSQNAYCSAGGGCGSVIELVPPPEGQTGWTEQTLWTFQGGLDGAGSFAPLTEGANGVLYGTTQFGGGAACSYYSGCGTVFALTPPAERGGPWTEQILAAFPATGNGNVPDAAVIIDREGALYGTTSSNFAENGTVFRVNPPVQGQTVWSLETLFNFAGNRTGSVPYGPLTADKAGTLFGTTLYGGETGNGIVFSLKGTGFVP